jgi:hypothetical protein
VLFPNREKRFFSLFYACLVNIFSENMKKILNPSATSGKLLVAIALWNEASLPTPLACSIEG